MADNKFGEGLKKVFLAGVGAIALSAEKGSELIEELVKKGELTVEQGKDLNKDLQRGFKDTMDKRGVNIDELVQKISKLSSEEKARFKEQFAKTEKIFSEKLKKADEAVEEFAEAVEEKAEELAEVVDGAVEGAADAAETIVEAAAEEEAAVEEEEACEEEACEKEACEEEKPEEE